MIRTMIVVFALFAMTNAHARQWQDETGTYTLEAELVAFDEENVVLQRGDGALGMLKLQQLSENDREYLASKEAQDISKSNVGAPQTWTTTNGLKLVGRIVGYASRDVTIVRRRGRTFVNDRQLTNLPETYRQLLPALIEHFDGVAIPNDRALQNWLRSQRNQPRTLAVDGVVLMTEDGDEYVIPFFVFKADDRKLLQANWAEWQAWERKLESDFRLETLAAAHLRNQEIKQQIALIDLNLHAVRAGLTSVWEVTLFPEPGNPYPPQWLLMPGRDSAQATAAALRANPGFTASAVRRVSR
jgi:hypothetical protein